jgi:hypothetical protein
MDIKNQINIFIVDDNKIFTLALKAGIEITFKHLLIKIYSIFNWPNFGVAYKGASGFHYFP